MPQRDFNAALTDAAKQLDGDLPAGTERRLRARLNGEAPRARTIRWGRVAFAAAAAAAAVVLAIIPSEPKGPASLGGFAVVEPSADLSATGPGDVVKIASGHCTLRDDVLFSAIAVTGPATLRRITAGVEVQAGTVELDVDHDHPRVAPYAVRVSHGTISVLGTRFTVTQREGGGEVTLHRGSIQFRSDDGQTKTLAPGQSLTWPLPPLPPPVRLEPPLPPLPPPPVKQPLTKTPKDPPAHPETVLVEKTFDPEELLNQIAMLRSRGQYEEAVTALAGALREGHSASTNERLSFELGAILTRQLADRPRACAHWRRHLTDFPQGRYDREVSQARAQLGCEN